MKKFWGAAALTLAACLAAGTVAPNSAKAEGLVVTIDENGLGFGVRDGRGDGGWQGDENWRGDDGWRGEGDWRERRGGWRRDERRDRHERWERRAARCTPERALDKAAQLGLRRVRIRDIDRDTIEVAGRKFGERRSILFARAPSCPIIDW